MNQEELQTMAKETGNNGDKPTTTPMKGEVSWADPSRLFTGSEKIQQYNPSLLITRKGYQIIDKMRKDDQIKVSMTFKKHSIFSTGYDIVAPDGTPKDWEPKEFIEKCFEQMKGSLYKSLLQALTALDYGFSVSELIYESGDIGFGQQVLLKELKTRKPHSFEFLADEYGNLKTIKQYQLSGGWVFSGAGVELPVGKFVVFVHDMEWGNWYGQSDLESAYRPWWIKDNSYKWFSMLLERRGIPPIFALYDPNQFQAGLVDNLKEVMESIQAATTGVIPRATPQGLEFWAPQLAKEASDVFQKAIDMFNRDIARSILMPGLLGFTPDQAEGSYARSKVHFDVFMMVIEFLRGRVEDEVIQEQIIVPLCDYNYPNLTEYPIFKFKPITEEVRLDMMDRWITAVEKGVVVNQKDDEEHIRTVLQFPEKVGDEVAPGPNPPAPEEPEEVEEPEEAVEETPVEKKEKKIELSLSRTPNKYEQRIDFARIENRLQQLEDVTRKELIQLLTESRDALVGFVGRNWKDISKMVGDLRLKGWDDVQSVLGEFLKQAYDIGTQEMNTEIGHIVMEFTRGNWGHKGRPGSVGGSGGGLGSIDGNKLDGVLSRLTHKQFNEESNKEQFVKGWVDDLSYSVGISTPPKLNIVSDRLFNDRFAKGINISEDAKRLGGGVHSIVAGYSSDTGELWIRKSRMDGATLSPSNFRLFADSIHHELGHAYHDKVLGVSKQDVKSPYGAGWAERFAETFDNSIGWSRKMELYKKDPSIAPTQSFRDMSKNFVSKDYISNSLREFIEENPINFENTCEVLNMAEVRGPMFTPVDALKFLRNKNFYISSVLKDSLLKEAKAIIYNAIKVGEIPTETQQKLKQLFEPYVGNEDVLKPDRDGVMRATEPYRIETILRTNATESFNMGRLTEGRRLGKFVQGFQYSAILDDRTTQICEELDGRIFRSDDPQLNELTPPNHFNCRSLIVAIPIGVEIDSSDFREE